MTSVEPPRILGSMRLATCVAVAVAWTLTLCSGPAWAEDPGPEARADEPSIVALDQGERAPRAGMLIGQSDLVTWRLEIESLRYELGAVRDLHRDQARIRQELCRERLDVVAEAQEAREELWRARAQELADQAREAREAAREAAERGWWEHPALWSSIGVVATTAVVVGVQR